MNSHQPMLGSRLPAQMINGHHAGVSLATNSLCQYPSAGFATISVGHNTTFESFRNSVLVS
jgi:hypothetical protein